MWRGGRTTSARSSGKEKVARENRILLHSHQHITRLLLGSTNRISLRSVNQRIHGSILAHRRAKGGPEGHCRRHVRTRQGLPRQRRVCRPVAARRACRCEEGATSHSCFQTPPSTAEPSSARPLRPSHRRPPPPRRFRTRPRTGLPTARCCTRRRASRRTSRA